MEKEKEEKEEEKEETEEEVTFLIEGSSHSYHLALHCLALFLFMSDAMRAHWFLPIDKSRRRRWRRRWRRR